jgi:hypothetical protein
VSKVSPDQQVERAMVRRTKCVDASPSTFGGRLLPNERGNLTHWSGGKEVHPYPNVYTVKPLLHGAAVRRCGKQGGFDHDQFFWSHIDD